MAKKLIKPKYPRPSSVERVTASIFRNEDEVFSAMLKEHRHDKSFFIDMAKKAGIYDAEGKLEPLYKR